MDNLIQVNMQFDNYKKDYWKDSNVRDRQMALNLRWLATIRYPKDKIIVWAQNYHISKYGGHFPEEYMNKGLSMGSVFTQVPQMRDMTYVLGFTSYKGRAGRLALPQYDVPKPGSNSFENWINKKVDYSFTDFKAYNKENPEDSTTTFFMSGSVRTNMMHTNSAAVWNKIFDGVFFIREMTPCIKINR